MRKPNAKHECEDNAEAVCNGNTFNATTRRCAGVVRQENEAEFWKLNFGFEFARNSPYFFDVHTGCSGMQIYRLLPIADFPH